MAFPWKAWRRYNSLAVAANKKWELYVVTFANGPPPCILMDQFPPRSRFMESRKVARDTTAQGSYGYVSIAIETLSRELFLSFFSIVIKIVSKEIFFVNYGSCASCQQFANLKLFSRNLWNFETLKCSNSDVFQSYGIGIFLTVKRTIYVKFVSLFLTIHKTQ